MTLSPITTSLLALYNRGGSYTEQQLAAVYQPEICFIDPAHRIDGLAALCRYLNHQYSHVQHCEFIPGGEWASGEYLFLQWDMQVQHPKLASGRLLTVNGLSQLQCQPGADGSTRISLHRDYFDLGQLLYENVPVIGAINRRLKQGLSA